MIDSAYVIFNKRGVVGLRKTKPALRSGEVAVKMEFSISEKFFDRTIPEAKINIPDDYIQKPTVDVELKGGAMDKLIDDEKKSLPF